ncbi:LysM peptidoglycan-binding domain-containing protein [uncultured Roseobacter sp.]|uniref:LysM peptidoglycan-binding domain-containing protein n=1 Tax=uncultured Roseobacter sp. TaxID=114847 RepID=UPI0026141C95|nr:LysM peptidoglycan-binding domain-containing protein [uncultured Roseobacter sp.]
MAEQGSDTGSGSGWLWGAGIVIATLVATGVYMGLDRDTPVADATQPLAQTPVEEGAPVEEARTTAEEEETPGEQTAQPSIDAVRVEPDGLAVIAGQAEPGAEVSVQVDGEEIARATADQTGAFAAVGDVAPDAGARVFTLEATNGEHTQRSVEDVILAPLPAAPDPQRDVVTALAPETPRAPEPPVETEARERGASDADPKATAQQAPPDRAAVAEAGTTEGGASTNVEVQSAAQAPSDGSEQTAGETPAAPAAAAEPAQSVAVLRSTEEGVELLQSDPEPADGISIDTIGYSDAGAVQLAGRAAPGTSEVRVYLDNRFATALSLDENGVWRGAVPQVAPGRYRLRVDEVNEAGDVTSRIETPFQREAPEVLAEATADRGGAVSAVTVQTGDTLWAIARERYGEGVLYVRVFEANQRDIRDPDLIYPGQVFDLPVD